MTTPSPTDVLSISDLKARYFAYLDGKEWDRMLDLFAPDARFEGYAFEAAGGAGFVDTVSAFMADLRSQHAGYMPRFRTRADGTVRGVWAMHDYLTWEPGSRIYKGIESPGMHGIRGWGYYEDEYARVDGEWRVVFSRLVRTRIDPLVGVAPLAPAYDVMRPDVTWLD